MQPSEYISGNNSGPWLCFKCTSETFPFGSLNNQSFHSCITTLKPMNPLWENIQMTYHINS